MSDADAYFNAESEKFCKQFFDLVVSCNADDWKEVKKFKEVCALLDALSIAAQDDITISSRPSPCVADKVYKAECVLSISPSHALALCSPTLPYRIQWDPVLETLRVVRTVKPASSYVHGA
jgi:hypothetical protein